MCPFGQNAGRPRFSPCRDSIPVPLLPHISNDRRCTPAWRLRDGIEAGLGGGSAVAAAAAASAAEAQAARAAAEERAAAAALDVDRLSAQLQALQTSGGGAGAAVAAAGGGDVAAALQAWLPPNLQIVSLEPEAFAVEVGVCWGGLLMWVG